MRKLGVLILVIILGGCSATKLTGSWSPPDMAAKEYEKIAILVMSPRLTSRAVLEVAIANELKSVGVNATHTMDIFPLAGSDVVKEFSDEEIKEALTRKIAENEVDGLMIVALLDKEKEQQYVQGSSVSVGMPYGYGGYAYGRPYYGYYGYAYGSVYSTPGYYATTTTYLVESNLFDIESEQLIWTGQTETTDPPELDYESRNFAKIIVRDIVKKNAIKTTNSK